MQRGSREGATGNGCGGIGLLRGQSARGSRDEGVDRSHV